MLDYLREVAKAKVGLAVINLKSGSPPARADL
jgi:hypothetical protein